MMKRKTSRAAARRRRLRRDPFGRLAVAVGTYLESIGWSAVVVGSPAILGEETRPGLSRYQFLVTFTGGRRRQPTIEPETKRILARGLLRDGSNAHPRRKRKSKDTPT